MEEREAASEPPLEELARRLRSALRKERGRIRSLERARDENDPEVWSKMARALETSLDRVSKGTTMLEAVDPQSGEAVTVLLSPRLSPTGNLQALWRRYKKAKRGLAKISSELAAAAKRIDLLENRLRRVESGEWVQEAWEESEAAGARRKGRPSVKRLRRFRSSDGFTILVGRSAQENDTLTLRRSRPHDLFVHAHGYSGSHVIVRTGGREVPERTLTEAAHLALHYSKARGRGGGEVSVATCGDVHKPRRAKPGLVYLRRWRTLNVRVEPEVLENLLAQLEEKNDE